VESDGTGAKALAAGASRRRRGASSVGHVQERGERRAIKPANVRFSRTEI
jgi:hypothetical protein